MDYVTTDLTLAIAHHLLVFALAGIIAFEIAAIRPGIAGTAILRVAKADAWYGILAVAIIVVGVARAVYAAKGWDYYAANHYFWGKMAAFAVLGLLSVVPTIALIGWRRALKTDAGFAPPAGEIARVRRFLWLEVGVFAFIPAFAAAMARLQT